MAAVRTFIAFDTPADIRDDAVKLQSELKKSGAGVKWEPSDKFHVTVKFLGDVVEEELGNIIAIVENTVKNQLCFDVSYEALGCFPGPGRPKVIWIGVRSLDGRLEALKDGLDSRLLPSGFEVEKRKFHPHITLGRVKTEKNLAHLIPMLKNLNFEPHKAVIGEIAVIKSVLKPEGSIYSVLRTIQLKK